VTKTLHAIKKIILATIPVSGTKCAMNANSTQSTQVRKIPRATKIIILLSSYDSMIQFWCSNHTSNILSMYVPPGFEPRLAESESTVKTNYTMKPVVT
jgi:hypothetical protein